MYTHAIMPHRSFALKPLAAAVLMVCTSGLHAAPSFNGSPGNNVTVETNGSTTTVTQSATPSNRALANWNDFSISANEAVVFEQPNANSVILNRVLGNNASEIFGRLSANGRVFLINPNGIVFGANSEVNVGGLVASTLTLKPGTQNGNGLIEFELTDTGGTITSNGTINAKDIAFISPNIQNNGILNATGTGAAVQLIAASEVTANTSGTDLVLNVLAGHDNAVINQLGEVLAQGGKIVLLARSQAGGQASVINTANVARASQIEIQGDVVRLTGDINLPDAASTLKVAAQEIEQTSMLRVGGTTHLNADAVTLTNASNRFQGTVNANVGNQLNLRSGQDLVLSGTVSNATLQAENIALNGLQATGDVVLSASGSITQGAGDSSALAIGGTTQIDNALVVRLDNSMNDFERAVSLNGTGTVALADQNNLVVQGTVGDLTLRASTGPAGQVTLGQLNAESLNVSANRIGQSGAVEIENSTTLAAGQLELLNAGNDFQGQVNLSVSGQTSLLDSNQLQVAGTVNSAEIQASEVTVNGLTAAGNLTLQGGSINQSGALSVAGSTTLAGGEVNLDNSGNNFNGVVNVNSTGTARIDVAGDLELLGSAQSLTAFSTGTLRVSSLDSGNIELTANQIELQNFAARGDLKLNGGSVSQQGALTVEGNTRLGASTVSLQDAGNDFKGVVDLDSAGNVSLRDANGLRLQGRASSINAQAAGSIDQSAALNIADASEFAATTIALNSAGNTFGGDVALNVTDAANLSAQGNLTVGGQAKSLTASASETLRFAATQVATLVASGRQVNQAGALRVSSSTTVSGGSVNLNNAENDFGSSLALNVSGNATVRDANDLLLTGQAGTVDVQVGNTLTLGGVQVESGNFSADTMTLNRLNVQDSARLQASVITQSQAAATAGTLTLAANEVSLVDAGNDFQGRLVFEGVGTANIQDTNQLQVSGQANVLNVTAGEELTFAGTSTVGTLNAKATAINQTGALSVLGQSDLVADSVSLQQAGNDFIGQVSLQVSGPVQLNDTNNLAVQGTVGNAVISADDTVTLNGMQTEQLRVNANRLEQTESITVESELTLNAATSNLNHADNQFQGDVVLLRGNNILHTQGDLSVQGNASQLRVVADSITQSSAIAVTGSSNLTANSIELSNAENDFQGAVELAVTGQTNIRDRNNLIVSGDAQDLNSTSGGTLTLQELNAETLFANADQIQLNRLAVSNNSSLNATNNIGQTAEVSLGGVSNLTARTVQLDNSENDFGSSLALNVSGNATVRDANDLLLTGQAGMADVQAGNTLTLGGVQVESGNFSADTIHLNRLNVQDSARLQASVITQTQAAETSGRLNLVANTVSLTDTGNDFSGELRVNSATAHIVDSNDLTMTFAGGNLTAQAENLNVNELRATGDVAITADNANLVSTGDLSLQGQVGTLNVQARSLSQRDALLVQGTARLNADNVELRHQANDFQGEVALNVSGNAAVNDQNTLDISGRVQGPAQFAAQSLVQSNALITESDLLLQAGQIKLDHSANSLGGASTNPSNGRTENSVQLEGAAQAVLTSQGNLKIQGEVDSLTLAAQTVELGPLGSLQDLKVVANDVRQSAALRVEGQSNFTANNIELRNTSNDFVGLVNIRARNEEQARVALADSNSLVVQGQNMQFAAQVQGDLNLQADNLLLSNTVVQGSTTVNVKGELTQNQSIAVNNATLTADKITLNQSDNRFDGVTQVQSGKLIELGSASDLNLDALDSTGALALNVQGDAAVSGDNVVFANSVFNKDLNVTANDVSQTGRLMVQGDAQFNAAGGSVNLQNASNVFAQTVSVNAEQTNVSAQGDLRIRDLMTRGGAIVAEGRLILQGRIEQTGGTLSFTAQGIPRPLSSAEIAMMLSPELDVFSAKEAVDPLTGLGRISLAGAVIQQESGQIVTSADSRTQFKSTRNGSVVLAPVNQGSTNQINGQFEALAGQNYGQAFAYQQEQGASLFAVNNDVQLRVAGNGVESDVVAIRSRGLATVGDESRLRARMPYNDAAAGTSRSYAGLTLSIPLSNPQQGSTSVASFGESSGVGQQAASAGAIRVEVGELNRVGLGGFVTVLPFEGSNLLPGQVVYLAGPERRGTYAFFYDGARNLNRIPVVYNGSLLLSPQENAALTTAQGAVVLARQEQTRSVVRTENVAGKIINGVVAEVGPGRPATEGEGGAGKPDSCEAAGDGLSCNP